MPHKVRCDIDYDDDFDAYDDFYDDHIQEVTGEASDINNEIISSGIWRCAICTFDNDESMSACDICGIIRGPAAGIGTSNSDKSTVDGIHNDCGASIMARSLFPSLLHQTHKKVVIFQQQNDYVVAKEGNKFHKLGTSQEHFLKLIMAFSSPNHSHVNIVPFKFDVPSPDDLVSNGIKSSRLISKGNLLDFSLGCAARNSAYKIHSNVENLSAIPKGKSKYIECGDTLSNSSDSSLSNSRKTRNHTSSNKMLDGMHFSMSKEKVNGIVESQGSLEQVERPENIISSFSGMSLNVKSDEDNSVSIKTITNGQYTPETWMLPVESDNIITQMNLAIVGHVDSGKSTLSGRILHTLGKISTKEMHRYEKEAKLQGKGSFAYAFALDESADERERGITMTVGVAYFDSKKYHVVLLDAPGHKDFVPNMITGATQADAAILVVDASSDSFEVGMDICRGQTREHVQLIRSFGVNQIIVAVNKMDAVAFSKERFDLIHARLGPFLHSCGFKSDSVSWIPLSAIENQNLVTPASDVRLAWYEGPCLLDAIDSLKPPRRDFSKPLIMPICDVVQSHSSGQGYAFGKLEAGALQIGSKVLVMPSGNIGTVRLLESNSEACNIARAGDNVGVMLHGIDGSSIKAGDVLCHPNHPLPIAHHLELKIVMLEGASPILIGSQVEFISHHVKEAAHVVKILSLLDSKTGNVKKKAPRCITAKQSAIIEVVIDDPVCVEVYSECRALGRVFLRATGRTIGLGIIIRLLD